MGFFYIPVVTYARTYLWDVICILLQDEELQALFKNDQFSVEGELLRRQQEGGGCGLVNPTITRERPIFDENLDYGSKLPAGGMHRIPVGPGKVQVGCRQRKKAFTLIYGCRYLTVFRAS